MIGASKEFVGANILFCHVECQGYRGGDAGHGSSAAFVLSDKGGTAWEFKVDKANRIMIIVRGDSEIKTFGDSLIWAGKNILRLADKNADVS